MKGCDCSAHIRAQFHPSYAKQMGIGCNETISPDDAGHETTAVVVTIQPAHTGHNSEHDNLLNMSYLDERVKQYICELGENRLLPVAFIWSEAHKFSARITENLPQAVNTDTSRF